MSGKATTASRGYGVEHQRERARWEPKVAAGLADCHAEVCTETSRLIAPGQPWDLGHTHDRTSWTGPEHVPCNRSAGGRNGAAVTNGKRATLRHSRQW